MGTLTLKGAGVVPGVPWKLEFPGRHRGCPGDTTGIPGELIRVPRGMACYHKEVVSSFSHHGDPVSCCKYLHYVKISKA